MNRSHTLVVYYSLSGTTRVLGDLIAAAFDADVEELRDVRPRKGARGWVRSILEATLERRTAIEPQRRDPRHYDLVIIGTPVWNARVSSPVRTWIEDNVARLPSVALFATMGGRGGDATIAQMASLLGKPPHASLIATNDDVWRGRTVEQVSAFVHAIVQSAPSRPPPRVSVSPAPAHA
jgi:flavodoxin